MNKGASQKSRIINALKEDFISLDERTLPDLLQYTLDYSEHLNFFDLHNNLYSNWKSFLIKDPVFVTALIAKSDFTDFIIGNNDLLYHPDQTAENEIVKQKISKLLKCVSEWNDLIKESQYTGVLQYEILQLFIVSESVKNAMEINNYDSGFLSEAYNNLFGTLVFIREKALMDFESEIFNRQNHAPHIGLLLSFFKLFQHVQSDTNTLTKKHLDFYYLQLLAQKKRKPEPGSAIIELQLLPGNEEKTINENEIFSFNLEGNQKLNFITDSVTQINKAKITDVFTLFKSVDFPFNSNPDEDNFSLNMFYEEEIIRNGEHLADFESVENSELPAVLGKVHSHLSVTEPTKRLGELGIVIGSPVLFLETGKQSIDLVFKISPTSSEQAISELNGLVKQEIKEETEKTKPGQFIPDEERIRKRVLSDFIKKAFLVFISAEEGWKAIENFTIDFNSDEHTLSFRIEPDPTEQFYAFDNSVHTGGFKSSWPCIKLLLNNSVQYHPYKILKNLVLEYVVIQTHVENAGNLTLSNSIGTLDSSIPFTPFGPVPVTGSYLQIQNPLIFQKNLSQLDLVVNWSGLPAGLNGFRDYYRAYPTPVENNTFKAILTQNKKAQQYDEKQGLNEFALYTDKQNNLKNEIRIPVPLNDFSFKSAIDSERLNSVAANQSVYMVLTNPPMAFGHQLFSGIYAEAALKNSRFRRKKTPLPNQPYTPVMERLSVNYSNTAKEVMQRKQDEKGTDVKIIHLYPFGHVQAFPGPVKSQFHFLPQIENNGHLYIGLIDVKPGNFLNIGFELDPAVFISTVINAPQIEWEYLLNNEWKPFGELFLEDTTHDLIKSGIVKIRIPNTVQFDNTQLSPGKFWIRAVSDGEENLNSRIKRVFTQAVSLVSLPSAGENQIPDRKNPKIEKISFPGMSGIAKISGPFALEINTGDETEALFYTRTSEQLRHKNRSLTNWDVERLILEKFKGIDKVRVYGRNHFTRELIKGSTMQIVVIPKNETGEKNHNRKNMVDFHTLLAVKEYVSERMSPYTTVEVANPVYEHLKVKCLVKFTDYQKRGSLLKKLNTELINFLSPEIEIPEIEKGFDESFSKTEILNFIENRPYVDFVTEFSVLQLVEVQGRYKIIDTALNKNTEELRTISPYAILTSAPEHQIEIIQDTKSLPADQSGFGDLSIEYDFVISNNGDYN